MRRQALSLALLAAGTLTTGCHKPPPPLAAPKPPEVVVTPVVSDYVTDFEEFTGRTEAVETVEVRARASGYLLKANFKDGAMVHKGDLLFQIDPRPMQAELERAEANVAQAEAHVVRLEADYGRASRMVAKGSIGREEFDKVTGDLGEARAALKSARAARDTAKLNLEFCEVRASTTGKISRRMKDPGNMVKADETPLTTIVSQDPMYATFDIDERTYLRARKFLAQAGLGTEQQKKLPVFIGLASEEGFPHEGTVNFVDNQVDANSVSVWVRGVFANPDGLLTPGLFVRVRLPLGGPHRAILVPERALRTDQGQKYVFVVSDKNDAIDRRVEVGDQHGQRRVILQGVEPGERVIVSGLQRVRAGAKVQPVEDRPGKAGGGQGQVGPK
jgi:RND family efflux transporter MFP subunit